jgi:cardiolipin synthase
MELLHWSWISIAARWSIALVMIPVIVTRKEHPATCLAWLMIVFFEPWLGLILYLLIGEDRLVRKRLRRRKRDNERLEASGVLNSKAAADSGPVVLLDDSLLIDPTGQLGNLPVESGNSIQFFSETLSVIDRLIEDIDAAQDHVHLLFYIYADDAIGQRVNESLIRARQRGVDCRLLVDDVGSWNSIRALTAELSAQGVEFAASLPVNLLRRGFARIDMRNHRKLVVIDGLIAWTGSQNVVEDTYGHRKAGRWRDIMARMTGPTVQQFQTIFLEDWHSDTGRVPAETKLFPKVESIGSATLQVIPSGPDQNPELLQHLLVQAIHTAKRQVVLTSPYFVPDEPLLCALRLAAMRGVEVMIIVPDRSDSRLVDAAGMFYLGCLLRYGVRVFRFQDGLLHAKTMTVDDTYGLFGSANYDVRSFHLNFELNVSIHDQHANRELRWIQDEYRRQSIEFTRQDWLHLPWYQRLAVNIAKLFSPLL